MGEVTVNVRVVGAKEAAADLRGVSTAASDAGKQSKTAGSGFSGLQGKLTGAAVGAMAVVNGFNNIQDSFDDVARADLNLARAHRRTEIADRNLQKATAAMNDTLKDTTKTVMDNNGARGVETTHILAYNKATGDAVIQTRTSNGELKVSTKNLKEGSQEWQNYQIALEGSTNAHEFEKQTAKETTQVHQRLGTTLAGNALQMGLGVAAAAPLAGSLIKVGTGAGAAAKGAGAAGTAIGGAGGLTNVLELVKGASGPAAVAIGTFRFGVDLARGATKVFGGAAKGDFKKVATGMNEMIDAGKKLPLTGPIQDLLDNFHLIPKVSEKDAKKSVDAWHGLSDALGGLGTPKFKETVTKGLETIGKDLGLDKLGDQVRNFKWPTLPEFTAHLKNVADTLWRELGLKWLQDQIASIKWPTLPEFVAHLKNVADTLWRELGLKWLQDQIASIKWPTLPEFVAHLKNVADTLWRELGLKWLQDQISSWKWPTLPQFVAHLKNVADTLWKELGLKDLQDKITNFKWPQLQLPEWLGGPKAKETTVTLKAKDEASPVIGSATAKVTSFATAPSSSSLKAIDQASPTINIATGKIINFAGANGTASLKAIDQASPIVATATGKVTTFSTTNGTASLKAADQASPIISSATSKVTSFTAAPSSTTLKAIDQASPIISAFINQAHNVPGSTNTNVNANTVTAYAGVSGFISLLASIPSSKTVTINARVTGSGSAGVTGTLEHPISSTDTGGGHATLGPGGHVQYVQHGFGPDIVKKPTLFLAGEAGPEMVYVVPMANGSSGKGGGSSIDSGNGGGSKNIDRLIVTVEKLILMQARGWGGGGGDTNLIVDGQRMARVSQKYIGAKSYGDR